MSPARDSVDGPIDLASALDLKSASRYLVRVRGDAFRSRGVLDGDLLVVDAAAAPQEGSLVVAISGEETLLAVMERRGGKLCIRRPGGYLEEEGSEVWGVAVSLIRERLKA